MAKIDADARMHLCTVLDRAAQDRPNQPWIINSCGALTYREAERRAAHVAGGLAALGVGTGDVALVMLPDCAEVLLCWIAAARLDAADVPVNIHYRGDILAHVVNDSAARVIVIDAAFVDRLVELSDRLPFVERLVVRGTPPAGLPWPVTSWADVEGGPAAAEATVRRESDLISVMYTSGTTGPSKGVMIAHAHAYTYATATIRLLELGPEDVIYSAGLPLFHVAGRWGVVLAAAIVGATVTMPNQFSASRFWDDIRETGATKVFLLGAMGSFLWQRPADARDRDHGLKKAILAPLLPDCRAFAERFGIRLAHAFGATEFNTPILCDDATDAHDPALVGTVRSDLFEVEVVDDHDHPVPIGTVGEFVVRPRRPWIVSLGYWRHPEWTVESWRNLWFHTGDIGRRDEAGCFYFLDRKKDSIRRRGENISSMEVESVVIQHPQVLECAVFPIESAATEQDVMVAIVPRPDSTIDPAELTRFLTARMPRFMVPRYVDLRDALPKTPTGKILKADLRRAGLSSTTWDGDAAFVRPE